MTPLDAISLVIINGLSLALIATLLVLWKKLRKQFPQPVIFDLVAYCALIKMVTVMFLPAFLRIGSDWQYDRDIGAEPIEIAAVYAIEFTSYLIWIGSILVVTQMRWFRLAAFAPGGRVRDGRADTQPDWGGAHWERGIPQINKTARLFFWVICGLYLLFLFRSSAAAAREAEASTSLWEPVVMRAAPVIGLYLISLRRKRVGTLLLTLGGVVSVVAPIYAFATGVRGQVAWMGMWLFFLYWFVSRKRILLFGTLVSLMVILSFHSVMREVRGMQGFRTLSSTERIAAFHDIRASGRDSVDLASSLEQRLGEASRLSVGFFRLYNRGEAAGLRPIVSSLYAPIPRRFYPDKPEPGSTDGTKRGMGMYVIQAAMTGRPWNMADFFTGAHAYWEIGVVGVLLLSFCSGLVIALYAGCFARLGSAGLPLMMVMLFQPWNEPKLWSSQIILLFFNLLIPLLLLWCAVGFVTALKMKPLTRFAAGDVERGSVWGRCPPLTLCVPYSANVHEPPIMFEVPDVDEQGS